MEIVIDIPKIMYGAIKVYGITFLSRDDKKTLRKSIVNGTPLPEHHGRLGDLDALEEYFRNVRKELKASDYKNAIEFFVRDEMLLNFQQFVHLCDAIIEADKEK